MHIITKYFPDLSNIQLEQFLKLNILYSSWNKKINVVSRSSIKELYLHHVLHSLSIAKVINFVKDTDILDIGTGGGFPGIPLAILFPKVNFTLNDSIGKKIKVVNNIIKDLQLNNVQTIHSRAENIDKKFDFIISRAVTNMKVFNEYARNKFNTTNNNLLENGILYLKGGDLTKEMEGIDYMEFNISEFFSEEFFVTKKIIYINSFSQK